MRFETKIAVALREDVAVWQKLNMTAFMVSGIAGTDPSTVGEEYVDASGTSYLPMFRQPVLVFGATGEELRAAYERAMRRGLRVAIFTEELFATGHDEANRAAVAAVPSTDLQLVGMALRAERNVVDRVMKGLRLHG